MESNHSILLVEDDKNLGFVVTDNLERAGYNITMCENGAEGVRAYDAGSFDLCILDVMLPEVDGFQVAAHIRKTDHKIPILFLTAKSMKEDRLKGFEIGGDDYITKPFSIEELIYRINVFLKRSVVSPELPKQLKIGSFILDVDNLELSQNGSTRRLTQKEMQVLKVLGASINRVVERPVILEHVWGEDDYFMGRSLDVFISRLRKYLRDDPNLEIVNYHGVGFKLRQIIAK
jgi:DNA-binding response OmpR family regulator